MPSQYNKQQVQLVKDKLDQAKSVIIVDYSGTNADDQVKLRAMIKQSDGEMLVVKNTLIDRALDQPQLKQSLTGMNALVFSYQDAIAALKQICSFQEEEDKLELKQGLMLVDGKIKILNHEQVQKLSQLPGKDEVMVMLIRGLQGPAYGLVNVLQAGPRNLVYALQAIADQEQN